MIIIPKLSIGQKVTISHNLGSATYLVDGSKIKCIDDCMDDFKTWLGLKTLYLHEVCLDVVELTDTSLIQGHPGNKNLQ